MPGFETHSASAETEHAGTIARNSRIGLQLFAVYFVVYAGFVIVNAFRPDWMEKTPFAGINVAILYGFSLIVGALVMSLIYGWLCHAPAKDERRGDAA
jgi:uncharacterized membrane protein (DUF485 family)